MVQPGSLDSEAGIFASTFDLTGTRLITCEADKTIKIWKEKEDATPETDPIDMEKWKLEWRARRRFFLCVCWSQVWEWLGRWVVRRGKRKREREGEGEK